MPHVRVNDRPEDGIYLSRARQAVEEGLTANDEVGDKQAGDGLIQVPVESLHRGLDIVRKLKDNISNEDKNFRELDELEKIFEDIVRD